MVGNASSWSGRVTYVKENDFSPSVLVAQKVAVGVYKGVTTSELDELAAETAASMTSKHPDYAQVRKKTR